LHAIGAGGLIIDRAGITFDEISDYVSRGYWVDVYNVKKHSEVDQILALNASVAPNILVKSR